MGLIESLPNGQVALDAATFIYYVEAHPEYVHVLDPLFDAVADGERSVVTSGITLLEVLVVPLRAENRTLEAEYETLLTRSRGVRLIDVDVTQLRTAAGLRAAYGFRTPDALQLAAALTTGCPVFLTNDRQLRDVPGLRVLQLRDFR